VREVVYWVGSREAIFHYGVLNTECSGSCRKGGRICEPSFSFFVSFCSIGS